MEGSGLVPSLEGRVQEVGSGTFRNQMPNSARVEASPFSGILTGRNLRKEEDHYVFECNASEENSDRIFGALFYTFIRPVLYCTRNGSRPQ